MKKLLHGGWISVISLCILVSGASASNRFNVYGYHTWQIGMTDTAEIYAQADSFGLSLLYTLWPKSAARVIHDLGLHYSLVNCHFGNPLREDDRIFISPQYPDLEFELSHIDHLIVHTEMAAANPDPAWGYEMDLGYNETWEGGPRVTSTIQDDHHFLPPLSALEVTAGSNDPGYIYGGFLKANFDKMPKWTPLATDVTLEATMRLLSDTGDYDKVVAQLIFEDGRVTGRRWNMGTSPAPYACLKNGVADSTNPYAVQRYNDTLLIVGSASGWRIVPAIPSKDARFVYTFCDPNPLDSTLVPSGPLKYFCYVDPDSPGDTICSLPFRSIKDIHLREFSVDSAGPPDTSSYYKFSTSLPASGNWAIYRYKVLWLGENSMYLDSLLVFNERGKRYYDVLHDQPTLDTAAERVSDWYRVNDAFGSVHYIQAMDEPCGPEFQQFADVERIIEDTSHCTYCPDSEMVTLRFYGYPDSSGGEYYFDTYYNWSKNNFLVADYYPPTCDRSSASDPYSGSIPALVDSFWVPRLIHTQNQIAAAGDSESYWVTLNTEAAYQHVSCPPGEGCTDKWVQKARLPTPNELHMYVNLFLLYGAHGIGYYKYMASPSDFSKSGEDEQQEMSLSHFNSRDSTYRIPYAYYDTLCATSCSCYVDENPPYTSLALVSSINGSAVRQPLWYTADTINHYLDSMAAFFLNADWLSAGRDDSPLYSLNGSFIDSVKAPGRQGRPYIQVGFFSNNGSQYDAGQYAYILNYGVDDGSVSSLDTETVTIYMSAIGAYQLWDVYADRCDTLWDSAGVVQYNHFFQPGEALLLHLNPIDLSWAGTLNEDVHLFTLDTVHIVGDLTVASGHEFTLGAPIVVIASDSDSISSGNDTNSVEIIVDGALRIVGSANNPVELSTTSTSDSSWYGIWTSGSGNVYANYAEIRHAYVGLNLWNENADTVTNCTFDSCYMYGICSASNLAYFYLDTFRDSPQGYGIYEDQTWDSSSISHCSFKDVKNPVYLNYRASPTIHSCEFRQTTDGGVNGPAAITALNYCDPTIEGCYFNNVPTAIALGARCNSDITGCAFDSDNLGAGLKPFMHFGITATAIFSHATVRSCCFKDIGSYSVYIMNGRADLGDYLDDGNNNLFADSAEDPHDGKWVRYPDYAICFVSLSGDTIPAEGCWFHPSADIYGGVDTIPSLGMPAEIYCGPTGGITKLNGAVSSEAPLPEEFFLEQNYPNPFNSTTSIRFSVPERSYVRIEVYNMLGQAVTTLFDGWVEAGDHEAQWDGNDAAGNSVATGIYLYRFNAGQFTQTRKMLLLK